MAATPWRAWVTEASVLVVVIVAVEKTTRRRFMLLAREMGMTNGEYVYITVDVLPDEQLARNSNALWSIGDQFDEHAKDAFMSVYHVGGELDWLID